MDWNLSQKLSEFIWINGKIISWDQAYIHVLTHSLHYSGAVFEGERAYNGKIFKLKEHTERLLKSAKLMNLEIDYSSEEIQFATKAILEKNNLKNAYIRPLIWRGAESIGIYSSELKTNLLILAKESNPPFYNGLKLCISPWRKMAENSIPAQAKSSAHYAMSSISQKLAQDSGYDDALLLDQFDNIAECSTTNIFFGNDNKIVTPIADRFLNGITRQAVIEIAEEMGLEVHQQRLSLKDITKYDMCFITGTSGEITGVSSINIEEQDLNKKNTNLQNIDKQNTNKKNTSKQILEFTNDKMVARLQQEFAKTVGKKL